MAKIELSPEVRAVESLIDAREQTAAGERMQAIHGHLGRRPEYRYLLCLYEATFHTRGDADLVRDVTALVADQPDLAEASALLAELCARTGDRGRAELFARSTVESGAPSHSAIARAEHVLRGDIEAAPVSSSAPSATVAVPLSASETERWFEQVRGERVHHRAATYGVRLDDSLVDMLLDWGRTVALGRSFASSQPLPLTRASLGVVDEAILEWRRQPGAARSAKGDTSHTTAAAGFFLAVLLHELKADVIEISADDGGCKAILPSGAGARPLLIAAAFCGGEGPSLTHAFDRMATARELATATSGDAPARFGSSNRLLAARPAAPSSVPPPVPDELAVTRAEAESAPLRRLDRRPRLGEPPALDMNAIAATLASTPVGRAIAERSGAYVSPTPANVEALESYCVALRGSEGEAPRDDWQPSESDEELILVWGAFLGEALIAAFGGVWERDPLTPADRRLFRVVCEDRVVAWPLSLVYLRLKNGARYDLTASVGTVGRWLAGL